MSDTTMRVPQELKDKLESYKSKLNYGRGAAYEVIEKLMYHYDRSGDVLRESQNKSAREIKSLVDYQESNMVDVGPADKQRLQAFRAQMGFRSDGDAVYFLLATTPNRSRSASRCLRSTKTCLRESARQSRARRSRRPGGRPEPIRTRKNGRWTTISSRTKKTKTNCIHIA